jgi:beta-glucosidase
MAHVSDWTQKNLKTPLMLYFHYMHKNKVEAKKEHFFWGAATAAHQVEGNLTNQWTVWEIETADDKARLSFERFGHTPIWESIKTAAAKPQTYISGELLDHYHTYEEDFALLEAMHMNVYRFSIEWSRIEPNPGQWNSEAIDHYRDYIAALKKRNIEPIMTLFHFSLPVWFSALGGFEEKANIPYFTRFVEKVIKELGGELHYIITINEPEVYVQQAYLEGHFPPQVKNKAKALRTFQNLARAHNVAYDTIKALHPHLQVSVAKDSAHYFAGDTTLLSRFFVRLALYLRDDYFLKQVIRRCDYLGVNYYFSNRVVGNKVKNLNTRVNDLGWDASPGDIEHVLMRYHHRYNLPIIITENGIADKT